VVGFTKTSVSPIDGEPEGQLAREAGRFGIEVMQGWPWASVVGWQAVGIGAEGD